MQALLKQFENGRKHLQLLILALGLILATLFIPVPAYATGVYDMPNLETGKPTWVLDQAEVLSRLSQGKISTALEGLANQTGQQVRIVTVHRLDYGETTESFTKQLFEKWFPTPEAQANQILLVIDNVTNNTAIRTGSDVGLPPEIAQSITEESVMVPVRKGNYNEAFLQTSDRLIAVLSGRPDPGPPKVEEVVEVAGTFKSADETDKGSATLIVVGFLVAATVIPMATYYFYQFMQSQ